MKKTLVMIAVGALAFVGCKQRGDTMNESAGAEKSRIEQNKDAQQDALDQQKKQVNAQEKAQKDAIEAQSDAQKAQLDAEKKQLDAQAKADKAQVEAQEDTAKAQAKADSKINEAAGAASNDDTALETRVRTSLFGDQTTTDQNQNITIKVKDGKVSLTGTVKTQAEKDQWEQKAKSVSGVSSVDNQIKVQE